MWAFAAFLSLLKIFVNLIALEFGMLEGNVAVGSNNGNYDEHFSLFIIEAKQLI